MTLLLDAGALIAYERGDATMRALIKAQHETGRLPLTHAGIVGQVWRSPRQVRLARLLRAVEVRPLQEAHGRDAGLIIAAAGMSDVVDAALVGLAGDGDTLATSDPGDIRRLASAARVRVRILPV